MKIKRKEQGFTLIELLLVVVIIGLMLAVIVPRAWRANIDAKYGNVRQNASELASVAVQWAENQLEGQNIQGSDSQLVHYLAYIAGGDTTEDLSDTDDRNQWVGDDDSLGWQSVDTAIPGRDISDSEGVSPSGPAKEMMPIDRRARNPFNGMDVFEVQNDPLTADEAIPGAIGSGYMVDLELGENWYYFALRFQGTDNEGNDVDEDYHADMEGWTGGASGGDAQMNALNRLRAGIFMARAQLVEE